MLENNTPKTSMNTQSIRDEYYYDHILQSIYTCTLECKVSPWDVENKGIPK